MRVDESQGFPRLRDSEGAQCGIERSDRRRTTHHQIVAIGSNLIPALGISVRGHVRDTTSRTTTRVRGDGDVGRDLPGRHGKDGAHATTGGTT